MRNHGREFVVGIVFFALLGALGVLTINLSGDALQSGEQVTFRFDNVAGLKEGDEVWLNGLPSGTVKEISIGSDGIVTATAKMRHGLAGLDLGMGAKVQVQEKSSLGGAVIAVETRREGEPALADAPRSVEDLQARTWTAKAAGLASVGETAMKQLEGLSEKNPGFLGKALGIQATGDLMGEIRALVKRLDGIAADVERGTGTAGLLLRDPETRARVERILANLESVSADAKEGQGALGMLLRDREVADKVRNVVDTLDRVANEVKEGKGNLGKFLGDDSLYAEVKAAVANIRTFSEDMNRADGLLPRLVHDRRLAEDFEGLVADARLSVGDLRGVVADMKAGKGTLGRFLTDETLYNDLKDTVRSVQRSFEEARENAPILTFSGFLFKTF